MGFYGTLKMIFYKVSNSRAFERGIIILYVREQRKGGKIRIIVDGCSISVSCPPPLGWLDA